MEVERCRRRRDYMHQQWKNHGGMTLAAAALLGWALYLLERRRNRRSHGAPAPRPSPVKNALSAPASHRLQPRRVATPAIHDTAVLPAPLTVAAAPAAGVGPTTSEREELHETLATRLGQLRGGLEAASASVQLHSGCSGSHRVSASLLLVREEVQLLDLASELEALRAQLDETIVEQARTALSASGSATPSRRGSGMMGVQGGAGEAGAAAAGVLAGEGAASALELPSAGPSGLHIDGEQPAAEQQQQAAAGSQPMAAFQQRLTPLLLRASAAAPPDSPLLHSSLQPSPDGGCSPSEQESWLLASSPGQALQHQRREQLHHAAVDAAVAALDSLGSAPPAPAPGVSATPTLPSGLAFPLELQQEVWSPKATMASLADLRRSTPAAHTMPHQRTGAGGGTPTRRTASAAASEAATPVSLGRMLRHTASACGTRGKQLTRSLESLQEQQQLTAAARKAAEALAGARGNGSVIPAWRGCGSAASTPASSRPHSARLLMGEETPGSSRIPKPRHLVNWSPANDPSSRIPRPN